jgi:hypothetical protein
MCELPIASPCTAEFQQILSKWGANNRLCVSLRVKDSKTHGATLSTEDRFLALSARS